MSAELKEATKKRPAKEKKKRKKSDTTSTDAATTSAKKLKRKKAPTPNASDKPSKKTKADKIKSEAAPEENGSTNEVESSPAVSSSPPRVTEPAIPIHDGSSYFRKTLQYHVSLLPASLASTEASVKDSIRQTLLHYSSALDGVMLSFRNVKVATDSHTGARGVILNELPHLHYRVTCEAMVFSPSIGCKLRGTVNACFPSHIGILVLDYFNATISADRLQELGYYFEADSEEWKSMEEQEKTLVKGTKVEFVTSKIYGSAGALLLEGDRVSVRQTSSD